MPVRRKGFSDPEKMWTAAADNVAFFFPVVSTMETADLAGVRPAFELTHMTGAANAILITPAYQLSNDGEVWDDSHTCTVIPNVTTRSAEGIYYHGDFETLTLNKKFIRFGFKIINASGGTALQFAQGALRLEFKRC